MKKRLIIILIFSIGANCFSQVSGYLGKRFIVGYSNYFMIAGVGPVPNATAKDEIGINTTNCLNVEYIIKKRTSFCYTLQILKTGVYPAGKYIREYPNKFGYNISQSYEYNPKPYIPMQLTTIVTGLSFKFYKRAALAPIGKYIKPELLILFSTLTYKKNSFSVSENNITHQMTIGDGKYKYTTFAIAYTMGRSRVFNDKIVLDYGLRLCLVPAGVSSSINFRNEVYFSESNKVDFEKSMKYEVYRRLLREQFFNFHIGIGFLAF